MGRVYSTYGSDKKCRLNSGQNILLRIDPLLGNDSVNTFQRTRTRATIGCPLLGNGSVTKPSQQQRDHILCVVPVEGL
jgi:hypothetical protein